MTLDTLIKELQKIAKDNPYREVVMGQYDELYCNDDGTSSIREVDGGFEDKVILK
jgi:hypothetical protein